jgi:demethylmenaquinone methyltransferase / 2-methoxy-6-polyprenyl-1,4-benzoquinol methylase
LEKPVEKRYLPVKEMTDADRIRIVKDVFRTVTGKYDFLNHFLSLRRDVAWRTFAVRKMRFTQKARFLDVATGTGDVALGAASTYPHIRVTGLDFVREMLGPGKIKIEQNHLSGRILLLQGDALNLPFPDNSFDVSAIAFGLRNIPDKTRALKEMIRVVAPGGQVMVLEMTFPRIPVLKGLYGIYLTRILPRLARLFSKNPAAYEYLGDSIKNFLTPDALERLMEGVGLSRVEKYALTLGITYLHIGYKLEGTTKRSSTP